MALTAEIRKRLSHFTLDVSIACPKGRILSIVGPSGSGKTTILRIIAGLDAPDEGVVVCGERVWLDTGGRVALPTQKRRLAMVFQDFVLFPHCSVFKNVCFAARGNCLYPKLCTSDVLTNTRLLTSINQKDPTLTFFVLPLK